MADLLDDAVAWLDGQRAAHLSRQVIYERGGETVEVAATLGSTRYEVADDLGATIDAKATDFIVSAADLVLGGILVQPQPGDTIRVTRGTAVLIYEVMDLLGVGHFQPCDPAGQMLRIHAKQVQ